MDDYGFGKDAPPGDPAAIALVQAIVTAIDAQRSLLDKIANTPLYTGQWEPKDYFQSELHERNMAASNLLAAVNK